MRSLLKALGLAFLLRPFRGLLIWASQSGFLPSTMHKLLPWRWTQEPFTIHGDGWKCRWFPTEFDDVGRKVFRVGPIWEPDASHVILANLRTSRCFIDVGANCGIYTVLGCAMNPRLKVVAIEPVDKIFQALANNVRRNEFSSRVTALNVALGDSDKMVGFHEAETSTMGSLALDGYHGQRGKVVNVQCRTLDSIVAELNIEPDFLKIDVEGFEHLVLSGASRTIDRFHPHIVLEANPGDPAEEMTTILSRYGYEFQIITNSGLEKRPAIVPTEAFHNWLCVPINA